MAQTERSLALGRLGETIGESLPAERVETLLDRFQPKVAPACRLYSSIWRIASYLGQ